MINDATSIPSSISNTLVSFDCPTLSPADISTAAADAEAVAAEALKKNEIGQSENVSGREVADEGLGMTGPVETARSPANELENQDGGSYILKN